MARLDLHRVDLSFPSWGIMHFRSLVGYLRLIVKSIRTVRQQSISQLHCGKALPEGFIALVVRLLTGVPYVCYVHGEELNVVRQSRELSWMTRRVLHNASLVVANSRNTLELLAQSWSVPESEMALLYPGVDTEYFAPANRDSDTRKMLNWQDRPVLLTVGRLQKRKGHDQLIRALPRLRKSYPNLLYAIAGDGIERPRLENLVQELELSEHVCFHGEMDDKTLRCAYQQCDLFVLPNRTVDGDFEGFGMVLLEAQACGRPVLAGDSGGTRETMISGQTGEIVDCNCVEQLEQAVGNLLADALRRESMGAAARDWVQSNFSWPMLTCSAESTFRMIPQRRYNPESCR